MAQTPADTLGPRLDQLAEYDYLADVHAGRADIERALDDGAITDDLAVKLLAPLMLGRAVLGGEGGM